MKEEIGKTKQKNNGGWIGVDLDGTLARYDGWQGAKHIGKPIQPMVTRVMRWIAEGKKVKIFTARVTDPEYRDFNVTTIQNWLKIECGLPALEVTNVKDYGMIQLWDDRAVQVIFNTGKIVTPQQR